MQLWNQLRASKLSHVVVAVLTAIFAIGVTVAVEPSDNGTTTHHRETVTLGGPGHAKVPLDPTAQAVAKVQQAAANAPAAGHTAETDLRAEPPAASKPAVVKQNMSIQPSGQGLAPATIPLASVNQAGCRNYEVRNQSSRAGSPSLLGVLHQTISVDNGWSGVLGNVHWFDNPQAQASSNYIVSRAGGQCALTVPESRKAWAQAGFNRVTACSIEVTETGREPTYLVGAGAAKVARIVHDCAHRWNIPLRRGKVAGCSVIRSGFLGHHDLGACGGGHHDPDPPGGVDKVIAAARALDCSAACRVRRDHARAHKAIRDHRCAPESRSRSSNCKTLYARNHADHARARQLHAKL
jgi:hypothetical protein